jgi:hypothetical protein
MFSQKFYGPTEHFWGWRCIYCGEVLDPTIIENRYGKKKGILKFLFQNPKDLSFKSAPQPVQTRKTGIA